MILVLVMICDIRPTFEIKTQFQQFDYFVLIYYNEKKKEIFFSKFQYSAIQLLNNFVEMDKNVI